MQSNYFDVLMNCRISKFVRLVLAVQIAFLGALGWASVNLEVPVLRPLTGFVYLSFVPGLVLLRVFRVQKLGTVEGLLLTIGLSISILMLTGLMMNLLYPAFGFSHPLAVTPLVITISGIVMVLMVFCYFRREGSGEELQFCFGGLISARTGLLCLPLILALFGVYLENYYNTNIGLMLLISAVSLIFVAIVFTRLIPPLFYPMAIFSFALALLYHEWLLSPYIWGRDIHSEYYFANLVLENHRWEQSIPSSTNGMLSIVILPPMYSILLGLDITWVFKLVFPIFFSLIPCGLYWALQKQMDCRIAFIASFFFVSMGFFQVWLISVKQMTAELFIVLLVMLLVSTSLSRTTRAFCSILFGLSLIVSHYGSSYVYLFCLVIAWIAATRFIRYPRGQNLAEHYLESEVKPGQRGSSLRRSAERSIREYPTMSLSSVLLFVALALTWYSYVSGSSSFNTIVDVGSTVTSSLTTEFLNPSSAQGLGMILTEPQSWFGQIERYVQLSIQLFIAVGVLTLVATRRYAPIRTSYLSFSFAAFLLLIFAVALPFFSSAIYTPRLYSIALIFVAPFSILGGVLSLRAILAVARQRRMKVHLDHSLKLLSILLLVIFLLNTGFMREVADGPPSSIPLSKERMMRSESISERAMFYYDYNVFDQDFQAVRWLSEATRGNPLIYSDSTASSINSYGMLNPFVNHRALINSTLRIETGAYCYLGYANLVGGILFNIAPYRSSIDDINVIEPLLDNTSRIYSNGGSEILMG